MNDILAVWKRLTPNQRMGFSAGIAAILLTALFAASWARKPEYMVLFSGLESKDAGQIVDELRSRKVPYRVGDGSGTIEVPANMVHELRLSLASEGMPHASGNGWELMDRNSLGMTDFLQNLNYQRALEGELARSITQLGEVQNARVHVVIPRPALFAEDKREPTASVVLRINSGARLGAQQVRGITHLVAGSVEGLSPSNITILDTNGNILSQPRETNSIAGLSSEQLEMQRGVEVYLAGKAQTMLAGVVGDGKVIVQVAADLDFEKVEKTVESWDADNPVVRSEQRSTQSGGESSVTNYEIGKTVAHVMDGVGNIKKLTAAVLVDGIKKLDEKNEVVYQARTEEELTKLTAVVRTAIGYDESRGDQVEVVNFPFETGPDPIEMQTMKKDDQMRFFMDMGGKVATGILLLVLLFFARSFFRKATMVAPAGSLPAAGATPALASPDMDRRIRLLAQEKPERIALVIKSWLKEDGVEA